MRLPIKFLRNAFIREKTECNKVASALSRGTKCMHFGGKNRSWRQRLIELVCTPAKGETPMRPTEGRCRRRPSVPKSDRGNGKQTRLTPSRSSTCDSIGHVSRSSVAHLGFCSRLSTSRRTDGRGSLARRVATAANGVVPFQQIREIKMKSRRVLLEGLAITEMH